jgi:hypothetical protein
LIPLKVPVGRMSEDGHMTSSPAPPAVTARPHDTATSSGPSIFLPKEHGSWSLALEPLALGFLVAPSAAGGAFAGAVLAGFFARRPMRALLAPGPADRRQRARNTFVLFSIAAAAGLTEAAALGGVAALWPVLLIAPLAALFLYFDSRNESRAAAAELTGSAAFALTPAVFASLAGWPAPSALALAAVMIARSVPTVLAVRSCLRQAKQRGGTGASSLAVLPLASAVAAVLLLAGLRLAGLLPSISVLLSLCLLLRAGVYTTPLRPAWPARRIGLLEAVLGAFYVGIVVLAWPRP